MALMLALATYKGWLLCRAPALAPWFAVLRPFDPFCRVCMLTVEPNGVFAVVIR